jgi:heme/copper-type cytochrome/quinol oxidase subunit 3
VYLLLLLFAVYVGRAVVAALRYNPEGLKELSLLACLLACLFVSGATAPSGPGPPHSRGF